MPLEWAFTDTPGSTDEGSSFSCWSEEDTIPATVWRRDTEGSRTKGYRQGSFGGGMRFFYLNECAGGLSSPLYVAFPRDTSVTEPLPFISLYPSLCPFPISVCLGICLILCRFYLLVSVLFLVPFCASLPLIASSVCLSLPPLCPSPFLSALSLSTTVLTFLISVSSLLPLFCPVCFCSSGHLSLSLSLGSASHQGFLRGLNRRCCIRQGPNQKPDSAPVGASEEM